MAVNQESFARFKQRLTAILSDWTEEMREVGQFAREEIVRTTLSGIAENDAPFAPYSESYQRQLDHVGGKPGGVVNLRGVFLHKGQSQPRMRAANLRRRGGGRRAYIYVTVGSKTFLARTAETRPYRGITDPLSEMSDDIITLRVQPTSVTLVYEPRAEPYMISHQLGEGRMPQRKWFSLEKESIRAGVRSMLRTFWHAKLAWFNSGGSA